MIKKIWPLGLLLLLIIGGELYIHQAQITSQVKKINRQISQTPKVCIQPYHGIDSLTVKEVKMSIEHFYGFEVSVLPPKPLPEASRTSNIPDLQYYNPSPYRFRADTIIRRLKRDLPPDYDYCIGLTAYDIATTKKRFGKIKEPTWMYTNWGIFGLGFRPGKSCVVSTYRLGRGNANQTQIRMRLRKIAKHELGHNLGLKHCPNACLMQDALETMRTIDEEPEALCTSCQKQIGISPPSASIPPQK